MEVKDAIAMMLTFGSFLVALLTYINHSKRK
ncbi:putative holin-like toxin [Paenibacillus mucilaginosus]|uniref:Holin-like toxin n=3 Tax=Paenibacillus mucilaginosus TaxID=61624 RepID=H6NFL5_9BACL|nr:putative holin-like toxin [Paenibacillus mucilaginosus]AFC30101.1 hypothetical protein PM3016_3246 [Paenibacillus mucilaginosus 3016]AFH62360.1 hypothetical protein B2K_16810 [Paenibacillus mucilaginosus K02]MCG7215400.1 putative holin-like toxin [Paenibacillus mucilaginosus]